MKRSKHVVRISKILQALAELGRSLERLKQEKERNMAVRATLKSFYEKHNFKKIEDLSLEELLACKTKLEDIREKINQRRAELLASMPLSENEK